MSCVTLGIQGKELLVGSKDVAGTAAPLEACDAVAESSGSRASAEEAEQCAAHLQLLASEEKAAAKVAEEGSRLEGVLQLLQVLFRPPVGSVQSFL